MANTRKDDGGQAFPQIRNDITFGAYQEQGGMTLRDWFAGQWAASQKHHVGTTPSVKRIYAYEAESAYEFADAMLAERRGEVDDDGGE